MSATSTGSERGSRSSPGERCSRPEPITAGSSPGTSEIVSASPGRGAASAASPPPFKHDRRLRTALIEAMPSPEPSSQPFTRCNSSSVIPGDGTSTKLEAPPEISQSMRALRGRSWTNSTTARPALRLRASGCGCADSITRTRAFCITSIVDTAPGTVTTSAPAIRSPRTSTAPAAIAPAALPMATTCHRPSSASRSSCRLTQRRPSTARSASRKHSSSSERDPDGRGRCGETDRRAVAGGRSDAPDGLERATARATLARLGLVRSLGLHARQVFRCHVGRDVFTRETGGVELAHHRIVVLDGAYQVVEILIDEPVGADDVRHLLVAATGRDELRGGRHVDAVHVRITDRRRGRGEEHLARAGLACEIDDLRGGRAAHDRVVDQQYGLALELQADRVQLASHRARTQVVAGHDEGTPDVAVLDEALAVLRAKELRDLQRAGAAGVGYRDHDVDAVFRSHPPDLLGQQLAHPQARLVDRDVVDDRVGARKIHVLEDARRVARGLDALLRVKSALFVDEHGFAGPYVTQQLEAQHVERDALRGKHVLATARAIPAADHQRSYAVRVPETEHAMTENHRDNRVRSAAAPVHRAHDREDVVGGRPWRPEALHLAGEDVEQHLGVGAGVQMPEILAHEHVGQLGGIGEVAVVREADAVRRVDIEGLGLVRAVASRRGIAGVPYAHVALEPQHVLLLEHVADQAVVLAQEELALVRGHDARGILAAMLQHRKRIVELLVDRAVTDDADDAAHVSQVPSTAASTICLPVST